MGDAAPGGGTTVAAVVVAGTVGVLAAAGVPRGTPERVVAGGWGPAASKPPTSTLADTTATPARCSHRPGGGEPNSLRMVYLPVLRVEETLGKMPVRDRVLDEVRRSRSKFCTACRARARSRCASD